MKFRKRIKKISNKEVLRNEDGTFLQKYPFEDLRVGKFFIHEVEKDSDDFRRDYSRLRSAAYMNSRRTGKKFSCSQVPGGIKVTRME